MPGSFGLGSLNEAVDAMRSTVFSCILCTCSLTLANFVDQIDLGNLWGVDETQACLQI